LQYNFEVLAEERGVSLLTFAADPFDPKRCRNDETVEGALA
jgi:hypothetical protein